jgi:toxin ParE1/3/4
MKVEYSRRALADLAKAGLDSRASFGFVVAEAVERRIREAIAQIEGAPGSSRELSARPGVHVVPLVKYPYKIFYETIGEKIEVLHIRHTSRRQWEGE